MPPVAPTHKAAYGTRDLADMHGLALWQARQALDGMGAAGILRVARCRVLPADRLEEFRGELRRRGWWAGR